jgi:hypothetical protein
MLKCSESALHGLISRQNQHHWMRNFPYLLLMLSYLLNRNEPFPHAPRRSHAIINYPYKKKEKKIGMCLDALNQPSMASSLDKINTIRCAISQGSQISIHIHSTGTSLSPTRPAVPLTTPLSTTGLSSNRFGTGTTEVTRATAIVQARPTPRNW